MDSLEAFGGACSERLINAAQRMRTPISGTFELLPTCNMHCRMCYIQHTPKREALRPAEFWLELFEQCMAEGLLFPLLTGGEPFLYPEFEKLYEGLARMPLHLCINTNATLLDRARVRWLAKKPPRRLNISLYGASDETYAALCGNPNGFSEVIRAFDLLKEYGIAFRVHSVMVPENVKDYQQIVGLCDQYQVPLAIANYMYPPYRREGETTGGGGRFTPKEMAAFSLIYLKDSFRGREEEYRRHVDLRCSAFDTPELYSLYGNNKVVCKAGRCTFWVDWRGRLSACGVHDQHPIDLTQVPFAHAWKSVVQETDCVRISEKCRLCRYRNICPTCPAAGFCETGAMDGTPEYLCAFCEEYARLLMEERRRLFGED